MTAEGRVNHEGAYSVRAIPVRGLPVLGPVQRGARGGRGGGGVGLVGLREGRPGGHRVLLLGIIQG